MPRRRQAKVGRPREFSRRVRLTVLLEERELRRLSQVAARAATSASAFVRKLIRAAIGEED